MNQTIKAIETRYKGYRFRSRLEARWAVFFDTIGEPWEYEKEGFDLNGIWYLPDFYIPRLNCFIEIKGQEPTDEEIEKAMDLRDAGKAAVAIFSGLPLQDFGWLFCWEIGAAGGGIFGSVVNLGHGDGGKLLFGVRYLGNSEALYSDAGMSKSLPFLNIEFSTNKFLEARDAARAARFEFGEQG